MAQPQRPYRNPPRMPPRRPNTLPARAVARSRRSGGCALLLLALFAVVGVGGLYVYNQISSTLTVIGAGTDVRPEVKNEGPPPAIVQEPFNMLVIGVDLRENEVGGGARSDTLIVVHVDPLEKWASMLSIPRDTLVNIPNEVCGGYNKVNAAYSCGYDNPAIYGSSATPQDAGAALAADTVEDFLGIKIDYTAQVDFNGFQRLVDTLGGITVDVPKDILDAEYPTEDFGYMRLYIPAGLQRMDGTTALRYARTRHADNDFGRAERQQQVLQAALDEIKRQGVLGNIANASGLLQVAQQSVRTTLKLDDLSVLQGLASLAQEIDTNRIQRIVMKPETLPDGSSNLCSGLESSICWEPAYVQRVVQEFQTKPGVPPETPAVVQVQNGSSVRGVARDLTVDLEVRGYNMEAAADAPEAVQNTMILDYTGKSETTRKLAEFLSIDPEYVVDASTEAAPPGVDIVIRIGEDYSQIRERLDAQGAATE